MKEGAKLLRHHVETRTPSGHSLVSIDPGWFFYHTVSRAQQAGVPTLVALLFAKQQATLLLTGIADPEQLPEDVEAWLDGAFESAEKIRDMVAKGAGVTSVEDAEKLSKLFGENGAEGDR